MRRIGSTPQQRGSTSGATCPDVIELNGGDYLVIGKATLVKPSSLEELGAAVGPGEQAVIVPRDAFLTAARQLAGEDAGGHDGKHAYRAYGYVVDMGRDVTIMTPWDDLDTRARAGWVNAATGVHIRSRLAAAEKLRKLCTCGLPEHCVCLVTIGDAAAVIDPRDPRSLDA